MCGCHAFQGRGAYLEDVFELGVEGRAESGYGITQRELVGSNNDHQRVVKNVPFCPKSPTLARSIMLFILARKLNTGQYPICRARAETNAESVLALNNSAQSITRARLALTEYHIERWGGHQFLSSVAK